MQPSPEATMESETRFLPPNHGSVENRPVRNYRGRKLFVNRYRDRVVSKGISNHEIEAVR